ncbi:hypothetical protein DFH09DRAFT_982187 [Mycena vulgaris]|nr:hypothetical protein DFH09DRAFT_982187 [Mycena vulgaris]
MGQAWQVVNLDTRETQGGCGEMQQFMFRSAVAEEIILRLMRPPTSPLFLAAHETKVRMTVPLPPTNTCSIMALPTELISHIFACINTHGELIEAVSLALACQRLWDIGRAHMQTLLQAVWAAQSWAGGRIICVGDSVDQGDLPDGPLTPQEIRDFSVSPNADAPYMSLAAYKYAEWPEERTIHDILAADVTKYLSFSERRTLNALISTDAWDDAWRDERAPYALRNLSRKVYVTETDLRALLGPYRARTTGLGELLMSRICWSSTGAWRVPHPGIHRGVWAGDRFDVVPETWALELKEHEDGEGATWADAAGEVVAEYEAICESWLS